MNIKLLCFCARMEPQGSATTSQVTGSLMNTSRVHCPGQQARLRVRLTVRSPLMRTKDVKLQEDGRWHIEAEQNGPLQT